MSIDLKALRVRAEKSDSEGWVDMRINPVGTIALLDRLEAAERERDQAVSMATKHGEVLQRIGTALGLSAGSDLHVQTLPALYALGKDAERYRFIRDAPATGTVDPLRQWLWSRPYGAGRLDEVIGAAMGKGHGGAEATPKSAESGVVAGLDAGAEERGEA